MEIVYRLDPATGEVLEIEVAARSKPKTAEELGEGTGAEFSVGRVQGIDFASKRTIQAWGPTLSETHNVIKEYHELMYK